MAVNYLSYTLQIHDHLMDLKQILNPYRASPEVSAWIGELERLNEKLETMRFQVAVVGEFKRGKTSFINALLRKKILPADVVPATATLNRITYGDTPASYIYWNDGRPREKIKLDQLADYITKLTDASAMQAQNIKEAVVCYPCRFCENNVDLIDTPGMNDDEAMNDVTIGQLSDIDLAIVTLAPDAPVSNTEAHFIAQLVESGQICQIVFVVSKIDTVFPTQRDRILAVIRERLQDLVREALLETHGEQDPVMEKYRDLLAEPILFPVSNTLALYAYEMGDQQALEDSGFQRLNEELLPIIIRTQHSAAVMTPLAAVDRISGQLTQRLQHWEQQTASMNRLLALKKAFAEAAYGLPLDSRKIWSACLARLGQLQNAHSDTVSAEILDAALRQRETIIDRFKTLFRELNAQLGKEERDSYQQIWSEFLCPEYAALCRRLRELLDPYPEILRQTEPELHGLTQCPAPAQIPPEPDPFYWESSPIPPSSLPPGQIAYWIDHAVRASFAAYYQRRQSRLAEFFRVTLQEQETKISAMVQNFFRLVKSVEPAEDLIPVDRETLAREQERLRQLIKNCSVTRDAYLSDAKNDR